MFLALKNNQNVAWQPTATLANLRKRAALVQEIRKFFSDRDVLEVATPLLCHSTVTDPTLDSFKTFLTFPGSDQSIPLYLQTSPEFAMKRLLAAGSGSIFQICNAFRNGELGKRHNPEFTLLEWYRVGFDHFDLMDEVDQLLIQILKTETADRISYRALFESYCNVNPHTCSTNILMAIASDHQIHFKDEGSSKDVWLDLLMTHLIEPKLAAERPLFVYDYPQSQAALAKIKHLDEYSVGERFEVYFKGIELANGYHELGDATEQQQRFNEDNKKRLEVGLEVIPVDDFLLKSLPSLPNCAGVALGLDRLIALALGCEAISDCMAFPVTRA